VFAPEGGIPAYCTDPWSEEQVLIEPYGRSIAHLFKVTLSLGLKPVGLCAARKSHTAGRRLTRRRRAQANVAAIAQSREADALDSGVGATARGGEIGAEANQREDAPTGGQQLATL